MRSDRRRFFTLFRTGTHAVGSRERAIFLCATRKANWMLVWTDWSALITGRPTWKFFIAPLEFLSRGISCDILLAIPWLENVHFHIMSWLHKSSMSSNDCSTVRRQMFDIAWQAGAHKRTHRATLRERGDTLKERTLSRERIGRNKHRDEWVLFDVTCLSKRNGQR